MELQPQQDPDHIRVSDHEREQVVELLGQAAAEGRLTLEEYADRAGLAYAARVRADLVPLTRDLPLPGNLPVPATGRLPAAAGPTADPDPRTSSGADMVAVFANESRKGSWLVPRFLRARSVFGDCHIEMQDARLQHPVTTIDASAIFGSVSVFVPDGVEVRLSGRAVFGSKESRLTAAPLPGAPVVEVRCRVWFGAVTVSPRSH